MHRRRRRARRLAGTAEQGRRDRRRRAPPGRQRRASLLGVQGGVPVGARPALRRGDATGAVARERRSMSMPPNVESPRELLLEQLGRLLATESLLERRILPELVSSTDDEDLKKTFAAHVEHTRRHVENIRKAFAALGAPPAGKPTAGLDGLRT